MNWQHMIYLVGEDAYFLVYWMPSTVPVTKDKNMNKTMDFKKINGLVGGANIRKKIQYIMISEIIIGNSCWPLLTGAMLSALYLYLYLSSIPLDRY